MKISITTETQLGLTWDLWKTRVRLVEELGFAGLYLSDHIVLRLAPDRPSLDLIVALTYAASHTKRIHLSSLVAPLSFRHPVHLARQFAALDDLSGGRMLLGLGAGHIEREHQMFGFELGDTAQRIDRFEEGLEIITNLLQKETLTTFTGRYYQLQDAQFLPRPKRSGGPPLLIGANKTRRMLPLVAKYADVWNTWLATPEEFRQRSALLDQMLLDANRQPSTVKRTVMTRLLLKHPTIDLENAVSIVRQYDSELKDASLDTILAEVGSKSNLVGEPEEVVQQIQAFADAGVEELIINFWDFENDEKWLSVLAEYVLPHFAQQENLL